VSVVLAHPTDIKRELTYSIENDRVKQEGYKSYLEMSEEVRIYVQPKLVTR